MEVGERELAVQDGLRVSGNIPTMRRALKLLAYRFILSAAKRLAISGLLLDCERWRFSSINMSCVYWRIK